MGCKMIVGRLWAQLPIWREKLHKRLFLCRKSVLSERLIPPPDGLPGLFCGCFELIFSVQMSQVCGLVDMKMG